MSRDLDAHPHHLTRAQVIALLEERDTLREQVRLLEEQMAPTLQLPRDWRLSPIQRKFLLALKAVGTNVLHKERAFVVIYGVDNDDAPDLKILDQFLCHLRRRLRESEAGITIETVWATGWRLDPVSLARLDDAIADDAKARWQQGQPLEIVAAAATARRYG